MLNRIFKINVLLVFALAFIMTACQKENLDELTTENFTNESEMGQRGPKGKKGQQKGPKCFKPVFPFTFNFSDGTSATVADKDEAKAALEAWKEANPDATERPSIAMPYDVELKDGTIVTIETEEDLAALKEGCEGPGDRGPKCFKPIFPITFNFSDGTSATVADKDEAKAALEAWKEANPDATERPSIAMPYDVELKDGTIVTIASEEDLAALKETCGPRPGGHHGPKCFKPIFPITFNFSDGTSATVADKDEAKAALQAWKEANPDATERPTIAMPYDVELQDGTVVTIASEEDLTALKEGCQAQGGGRPGGGRPGGN